MDQAALTSREFFQFWHSEKVRFSDTDMIGHVNNVAYAAYMESGRVAYTHSGVIQGLAPALLLVMARIELDYRAELHWPAEIDIGSRLLRIGKSSFAIGSAVFHGNTCNATSITTLVVIDRKTRQSTPLPENVRAIMEKHLSAD